MENQKDKIINEWKYGTEKTFKKNQNNVNNLL